MARTRPRTSRPSFPPVVPARWFRDRPEFVDTAYVAIGDYDHLIRLEWIEGQLPAGAEGHFSVYPRLFLGLTRGRSLAGLVTSVVLT